MWLAHMFQLKMANIQRNQAGTLGCNPLEGRTTTNWCLDGDRYWLNPYSVLRGYFQACNQVMPSKHISTIQNLPRKKTPSIFYKKNRRPFVALISSKRMVEDWISSAPFFLWERESDLGGKEMCASSEQWTKGPVLLFRLYRCLKYYTVIWGL